MRPQIYQTYARPLSWVGAFLCLAATALLVVSSVSVPIWDKISFLNVQLDGSSGNTTGYGVWGYTGNNTGLGWQFLTSSSGSTDTDLDSNLSELDSRLDGGLTKALVLHPIAAGLSFLYLILPSSFILALASIATSLALAFDLAIFGIARSIYNAASLPAQYGNANWIVAAALGCLILASFTGIRRSTTQFVAVPVQMPYSPQQRGFMPPAGPPPSQPMYPGGYAPVHQAAAYGDTAPAHSQPVTRQTSLMSVARSTIASITGRSSTPREQTLLEDPEEEDRQHFAKFKESEGNRDLELGQVQEEETSAHAPKNVRIAM